MRILAHHRLLARLVVRVRRPDHCRRLGRLSCLGRLSRDERGTALAEFALSFVVYVMMILSSIQVAIWVFTMSATQFAVWEGCRTGAAAYQPEPPSGTVEGGLRSQLDIGLSAEAAAASFAALDRIEYLLNWLSVTRDYSDLTAAIVEDDVLPGEEGRREIRASVRVSAPVLVPIQRNWLRGGDGLFVFERSCRLRLARYYSF